MGKGKPLDRPRQRDGSTPPLTAGQHVGARAPAPTSARERELAGRFADALEHGDTASVVALLTTDAWLTMPPEPHHYQGHVAIAAFLEDRALRRGRALRVIPTRANMQPAFGCYLPTPPVGIARAYGMVVLTLQRDRISAVTDYRARFLRDDVVARPRITACRRLAR